MPFGHILQVSASSREKPVFYSHGHIFYHPHSPPRFSLGAFGASHFYTRVHTAQTGRPPVGEIEQNVSVAIDTTELRHQVMGAGSVAENINFAQKMKRVFHSPNNSLQNICH